MHDEREDLEHFRQGDLVSVLKHYKSEVICTGIYMGTCPYEIFVSVLTPNGLIKEFDTVYYYLIRLK